MNKLMGLGALLVACGSVWAGTQENDLMRLARSGIDAEVLKAYVDVARGPYHFTVDQIIELNKCGVSSKVISEAIQHRGNAETTPAVVANESPSVPAAPPVATAIDTPTVISTPDVAVYPDPYYYDYWPYIGLGWGWGWGPNYYGWGGRGGYYGRGLGLRASAGFRSGGPSGRGSGGGGSRGAGGGGSRGAGGGGSRGGGGGGSRGGGHR